ncbi:MAG: SCO family protein [Anaerolineae bacterium]
MMSSRRTVLAVLLIVGAMATIVAIAALLRPYRYHGIVIEAGRPVPDFELTAHTGHRVRLSDFRGKLVVLYFGYTYCPDVCPTSLSTLARAMKRLGPKADQVQVLMITVDPERNTPEQLAAYMGYFDPRFIELTGTPDEIAAAATPFGIYYQRHAGSSASSYLVDHTATLTVWDSAGRLRLVLPFEVTAEEVAADLAHLLR